MKDFDHLVYYLILYMYALTDFSTGKNHTVFDHGILVNNAATTENGILKPLETTELRIWAVL